MYWQKRFDRENPDQEIEAEMLRIRKEHKNYGCLRMTNELKNRGFHVNKKKVQRLIRKLGIEVRSYTRKSRRYSSTEEKSGKWRNTGFVVTFIRLFVTKKLRQIQQSSNILKWIPKA